MRDFGYEFTMGAIKALSTTLIAVIVFVTVVGAAISYFRLGFDDTDNRLTGKRSDLRLYIDYGTGRQYVRASGGSITPRLSSDGNPICRGRVN